MKTTTNPRLFLTLLAVSMAGMTAATLRAQSETESATGDGTAQTTSAGSCKSGRHHHEGKHFAGLTEAERQQLKAAMKGLKENPQLVAARQAVEDAQTKEAKTAAKQAKRQLWRELLLKADPTLQPVLDKMKAAHASKETASEQE